MILNKDTLIKGFNSFVEVQRKQALHLRLFYAAGTAVIVAVLFFSFSIVKQSHDNIIVVNSGGELLPFETSELETLYKVLLTTHCYSVSYYVNSFDVNNIKNNQARAAFLVNQADLNAVFGKYQYDKAYSDALNKGVAYRCLFDRVESMQTVGNGSEYEIVFTSTLSIIDNTKTLYFRILSKGTAIRSTPRYPENPTGFYFKNYTQEYYPINNE